MRRLHAPRRPGARLADRAVVLSLLIAGALVSIARAQPPPVSPDDFVSAASGSDQYEIMAGHLALVESRDAKVRAFAQEMIRDHAAALSALQRAAVRSGVKPPNGGVGATQSPLLAALQSQRGAEFDRTYVRQQGLAHREALATERGYAATGSDANLRAAAKADLPMIERHLQAARRLDR